MCEDVGKPWSSRTAGPAAGPASRLEDAAPVNHGAAVTRGVRRRLRRGFGRGSARVRLGNKRQGGQVRLTAQAFSGSCRHPFPESAARGHGRQVAMPEAGAPRPALPPCGSRPRCRSKDARGGAAMGVRRCQDLLDGVPARPLAVPLAPGRRQEGRPFSACGPARRPNVRRGRRHDGGQEAVAAAGHVGDEPPPYLPQPDAFRSAARWTRGVPELTVTSAQTCAISSPCRRSRRRSVRRARAGPDVARFNAVQVPRSRPPRRL